MRNVLKLFLICLLLSVAAAQEREETELTVAAIAVTPNGKAAVLHEEFSYLVWEGQTLFGIKAIKIGPEGVTFSEDGREWLVEFKGINQDDLPTKAASFDPSASVTLGSFEDADLQYVVTNLASQCGAGWLLPMWLEGAVISEKESLPVSDALKTVLKQQEQPLDYLWSQGVLLVAEKKVLEQLGPDPLRVDPASDKLRLETAGVDLADLLMLMAKGVGRDLLVGSEVDGEVYDVSLTDVSVMGAFRVLLLFDEEAFSMKEDDGLLFVGSTDRVSAWSYPARGQDDKEMKMDFLNADLAYILNLLASKMELSFVAGGSLDGSVTCYLDKPRPAIEVLQLVSYSQEGLPSYQVIDDFLVVPMPIDVDPSVERSDARVDFEPEKPWVEVPLTELVEALRVPLEVKELETPDGLDGEVFARLSDAPAEMALALALDSGGYDYTLQDGVLNITAR
jgi:hypothetical protein